jgi:hypothetical protein
MKPLLRTVVCLLFALLAAWVLTGCKTTEDSDNEASRPWNAPRSWETGLPGFQNERR